VYQRTCSNTLFITTALSSGFKIFAFSTKFKIIIMITLIIRGTLNDQHYMLILFHPYVRLFCDSVFVMSP
jgi:hypothetical protein